MPPLYLIQPCLREVLVILTNFSINGQLKRLVFHGKTMNEKRRNIAARVSYHQSLKARLKWSHSCCQVWSPPKATPQRVLSGPVYLLQVFSFTQFESAGARRVFLGRGMINNSNFRRYVIYYIVATCLLKKVIPNDMQNANWKRKLRYHITIYWRSV